MMLPAPLMQQIQQRYAEPHRAYHTWQHITECLELAPENTVLKLAILGHDLVYHSRAHDNEEQSAMVFADYLRQANVSESVISVVGELILVTKHHIAQNELQALMVDIDLAILGSKPERFAEYERQIRQEYHWVEPEIYYTERKKVLQNFLSRASIYSTPHFVQQFEAQARENLKGFLIH